MFITWAVSSKKISMIILQTMRHQPESCPLGNPKNLDIMIQWLENIEPLAAKYGIKVIGAWADRAGHTIYAIFETPTVKTFSKFEIDPQNIPIITLNYIEKNIVITAKDLLPFFKEYKAATQAIKTE